MPRLPLHVKRALLQLMCALMLFAQHVALAHSVLHAYKDRLAQQELGVQIDRSDRGHAPKLSKLCAFDAVLGQVLGCAIPSAHFFCSSEVGSESALLNPYCFHSSEFLAPHSRDPPPLS